MQNDPSLGFAIRARQTGKTERLREIIKENPGVIIIGAGAGKSASIAELIAQMPQGTPDIVVMDSLGHMDMIDVKTKGIDPKRIPLNRELADLVGFSNTHVNQMLEMQKLSASVYSQDDKPESALHKWKSNLTHGELLREYKLIQEKKSSLPRSKRDYIQRAYKDYYGTK